MLDRLHWSKSHLDLETPEFQRNRNALRSMSRWWKAARSITISQHQLTLLDDIPQNCLLRWTAFDYPSRDDQSSGYRSVHSLLGCARFNITLPSHVRKLQVGVENPRGPEAVCMNIYELFTERMSVSFRVIPLARAYTPRKSPLPDGILIPDSTNQVMIMWDRRYFTAYINNYILGPVSLDTETAPGPPSQACPFVWTESARRALRHPQVFMQPMLSPVMPRADLPAIQLARKSDMRGLSNLLSLDLQGARHADASCGVPWLSNQTIRLLRRLRSFCDCDRLLELGVHRCHYRPQELSN